MHTDCEVQRCEETAFSIEDFEDLVNGEGSELDVQRIREAASFGIPQSFRAEVWKFLLGIEYLGGDWNREEEPNIKLLKRIRGEFSRIFNAQREESEILERVEIIIVKYLAKHPNQEYEARFVHLLIPVLFVFKDESDSVVYQFFCKLILFIDQFVLKDGIDNVLAEFSMLFHSLHPDIREAFEAEGIYGAKEWAIHLFRGLLSKELPLSNVLRLWDSYFASFDPELLEERNPEPMKLKRSSSFSYSFSDYQSRDFQHQHLHLYVILAILQTHKEILMELEYSEIKGFLQNLPFFDVDQLIAQAYNLRDSSKDLLTPI
jgi:TBC1 domain family member 2